MTKEINDIIIAYKKAVQEEKQCALVTVVHVEGSSYRRPGARMLVTDDGQLTGAISGGCLEGDALRKALLAINQQQNKLVTYDTTDEDDAKLGLQLGCNGIVHILFEPVKEDENPIVLLQRLGAQRRPAVVATLFDLKRSHQPGTSLLYRPSEHMSLLDGTWSEAVMRDATAAFDTATSRVTTYDVDGSLKNAFIEYIKPPIAVVIVGAGNDTQPLAKMTAILGWTTKVVDGRATHATAQRFPTASSVMVAKPHEVLQKISVDPNTAFLLMTHNYNYDLALLQELLPTAAGYIGVLGPQKKMERMWGELSEAGVVVAAAQRAKVHAPIGLDIGSETAEEIAVSIVAELQAVMSGRNGKPLRNKREPVHAPVATTSNSL